MKQTIRRLVILIIVLTSPIWISRLIWILSPSLPLKVKVIDYTVPYDNYAEHNALFWGFNHLKLHSPKGPRQMWDNRSHYIGPEPFQPTQTQRLSDQKDVDQMDLIYVGDTYGVYRDDFVTEITLKDEPVAISPKTPPEVLKALFDDQKLEVHSDYSQVLFGGLSKTDVDVLETHVNRGKDLVLEFNSFCDPTQETERHRAEKLVNLSWTGWSGRFFIDPQDPHDTPRWLKRLYEEQYPDTPFPSEPSLLLIHRSGKLFMISNPDHTLITPTLTLNDEFQERFPISTTPFYYFWFAVMSPMGNPSGSLNQSKDPSLSQNSEKQKFNVNSKAQNKEGSPSASVNQDASTPFLTPPSILKWSNSKGKVKQFQDQSQRVVRQEEFRILAQLNLPQLPSTQVIYQKIGISNQIPLLTEFIVTTQKNRSHRYHLAIDGSDMRNDLGQYHFAGLRLLNTISAKNRGNSLSPLPVFWQVFIPFLDTLLWERSLDHYPDFVPPLYQRITDESLYRFSLIRQWFRQWFQ